jgi:hypothetical protein
VGNVRKEEETSRWIQFVHQAAGKKAGRNQEEAAGLLRDCPRGVGSI